MFAQSNQIKSHQFASKHAYQSMSALYYWLCVEYYTLHLCLFFYFFIFFFLYLKRNQPFSETTHHPDPDTVPIQLLPNNPNISFFLFLLSSSPSLPSPRTIAPVAHHLLRLASSCVALLSHRTSSLPCLFSQRAPPSQLRCVHEGRCIHVRGRAFA